MKGLNQGWICSLIKYELSIFFSYSFHLSFTLFWLVRVVFTNFVGIFCQTFKEEKQREGKNLKLIKTLKMNKLVDIKNYEDFHSNDELSFDLRENSLGIVMYLFKRREKKEEKKR